MMRRGMAAAVVIGLAAMILAAGREAPAGRGEEAADYTRKTSRSYTDTLNALQEAAKARGFRVSYVHDIAASLKKEGFDRAPYASVEVCRADLASAVLKAEPRMGSLMPCGFAVYEEGSGAVVTMVLPSRLMTFFPVNPEVKKAAAEVDQAMKAMVDAATR